MKALFLVLGLLFAVSVSTQAQSIGKVTKITAATSLTGVAVFEDTLVGGALEYVPIRRGEFVIKTSGTGAAARASIYTKTSNKLIWSGLLTGVYVVLAGGNPTTQTNAQKLVYLKANAY